MTRHWVAIPNFVDTETFRPAVDAEERSACRGQLGVPEDALVIGTVAAVKRHHKRIDYLIREFAALMGGEGKRQGAGGKGAETDDGTTGRGDDGDGKEEASGGNGAHLRPCAGGPTPGPSNPASLGSYAAAREGREPTPGPSQEGRKTKAFPSSEGLGVGCQRRVAGMEIPRSARDDDSENPGESRGNVIPSRLREARNLLFTVPATRPQDAPNSAPVVTGEYASHFPLSTFHFPPFLLIAGARTDQSEELVDLAERLAPGRVKFLFDLPREQMPDLYRALDVFVLCSLFEMMPIAVLESLASGVPVIANRHPVLEWMVGVERCQVSGVRCQEEGARDHGTTGRGEGSAQGSIPHSTFPVLPPSVPCPLGGACADMSRDGELADLLGRITPAWLAEHGRSARARAEELFSKTAVIGEYIRFYEQVLGKKHTEDEPRRSRGHGQQRDERGSVL